MKKMLIADDNKQITTILSGYAKKEGFEPVVALDGAEALDKYLQYEHEIAVVLLDVMMPEMNGYEATAAIRAIKKRPDARRIPIIAMTANAFAEDVQASLDAGMNGHIAKPIVMDEVKKAIAGNVNR